MAAEENKGKDVDLSKILLPKKEPPPGASPASAGRVNAAVLLEQEQQAARGDVPHAAPPPSPPPSRKEESTVKPLQTYRGAIEEAIQHKGVSVVSIAAAEAKRRGDAPLSDGETQKPQAASVPHDLGFTLAAIAGGALLIAIATVVLLFAFSRPQVSAPVSSVPDAPFIAVDDVQILALSPMRWQRNAVMEEASSARRSTALSLGLMARLYVALASTTGALPAPVGAGTLLATLAPNVPDELLRSLSGEYLLGVHSFDGNQAFLILGVEGYEAGYAGMLQWEWTMQQELAPLFERTPRPRIPEEGAAPTPLVPVFPAATSSATSTTSTSSPQVATSAPSVPPPDFYKTKFIDRVVENHDARVIEDENGDILLLWTFLDRDMLVITTNEYTLREIISRRSRPPTITL